MIIGHKLGRTFLIVAPLVFQGLIASPAEAGPRVVIVGGTAEEAEIAADDSVIHRASRFLFPIQIGDMPLRKVAIYGKGDISVDYTLRGGGNGDAWVTLFVYPATHDLPREASDIEAAMADKMHPSRIDAPGPIPSKANDGRTGWYRGTFQGVQLTTAYVVVRRGDWFIQARASIPEESGQAGIERTLNALTAIPWDWHASTISAQPTL